MDFIWHGVSNVALQKTIKKETIKKRGWFIFEAFLWGSIPDLIPFSVPVVISLFSRISFWAGENSAMLENARNLYQYTHSLVIFGVVFLLLRLVLKRWYLAPLGWGLHIVMDMPLHAPDYFPTPFLFPLSSWTLPFGISWATWWIWGSLWVIVITWFVWLKKKKHQN